MRRGYILPRTGAARVQFEEHRRCAAPDCHKFISDDRPAHALFCSNACSQRTKYHQKGRSKKGYAKTRPRRAEK
jgi:hypothetical protein